MALRKASNAKYARALAKSNIARMNRAFGDNSVVERANDPCSSPVAALLAASLVANAAAYGIMSVMPTEPFIIPSIESLWPIMFG